MYEDSINELNKWFDDKERCFDTSHVDDEYCVGSYDVEDFCDYLRENEPDLVGIQVMVGSSGMWFKEEDLKDASYL